MASKIKIKTSTVATRVPAVEDLDIGELAINTADKKLYSKHSDNTIFEVGFDTVNNYLPLAGDTMTGGILNLTSLNPLTTLAESWIGPSSTTGIYFKGNNVGIGTTNPTQQLEITKNFRLPSTVGTTPYGIIYKGTLPFIHDFNYGNNGTVTTGGGNTFVGLEAGNLTMGSTATLTYHGSYNTANGFQSLRYNTTGYQNTAIGYRSLFSNTIGANNIANGFQSLYFNTTGNNNTAVGYQALKSNITGSNNTANGNYSGIYIADGITGRTTGTNGLYLGYNSKASADGTDNEIVIGASAIGQGSNTVVLGNTSITKTVLRGNVETNGTVTASNGNSTQWNTAYTHSQVTHQAIINGTGFVKASGTTISYDNSAYAKQIITIGSGVGLNTIGTSGFYRIANIPTDDTPSTSAFGQMFVSRGDDTIAQVVIPYQNTDMYFRGANQASIEGIPAGKVWRKVWHDGNFTNLNQLTTRNFSDLQNKPTTISGYGITDPVIYKDLENAYTQQQYFQIATLTAAIYVDWDCRIAQKAKIILTQNIFMNTPTHLVDGGTYTLRVTQDSTGNRIITWSSAFKWGTELSPTLSTTANKTDILAFESDGTSLLFLGIRKNF